MNKIIPLMVMLLLGTSLGIAQSRPDNKMNNCHRWRSQVDPALQRVLIDQKTLTDGEIEEGIGCLLKLKGLKNKARFYGGTKNNYNKSEGYKYPEKPATVDIAALYYASYLFYNNWEHASSVVLYEEATGKINTGKIVNKAFETYQKWYEKVLAIGLKAAREKKLDPLEGSGISWS